MQLAAWCWTTMRIWCKPKQHIFSRQNCKRFVQNQQNFFFSLFLAVMLFLNDEGRRHFPSGMKLQWFTAHESCLALQKSSSFEQWSSWTVLFTWFFFSSLYETCCLWWCSKSNSFTRQTALAYLPEFQTSQAGVARYIFYDNWLNC